MKKTIIGDPHLTHKSLDRGERLFEIVETIGLPTIWMGDFLDTKEVIRGKCLNALIAYLQRSKLVHTVIVGNHDWFNLECEAHALEALKLLKNVIVVDRPVAEGDEVYFPYTHDVEQLRAWVAEYQGSNRTLFAHLEVEKFDFGNGHQCVGGLKLSELAGFRRVISGHFHKYQTEGNLTYIGTPFSHSFGESNQVKYLGMYDGESDELKLAESPFPKHITIEFDCDNLNENCEHAIFDFDAPNWADNLYRVILTGSQANIDRFPKYMYEKINVKWISRPSDHAENQVEIDENVSNEAQFTKWAKDVRKLDEDTLKLGLQILEACR